MNTNQDVIILEDWGDALCVYKPAGWLTIPGRGNKEDVPVISHILGRQLRGGEKISTANDLFVVHRLDEGTAGALLFARTAAAHKELNTLFESSEVRKTYWCVVKGSPQETLIDAPLFKLPSKKNKSVVDPKGKPSQTKIKVLQTVDGFSLVEAQPLTGRSHQIRVHLSHVGTPLVGDGLYGGPRTAFGIEFSWPLLFARGVDFTWRGEKRSAVAQPDGEFLSCLEAMGVKDSCSIK